MTNRTGLKRNAHPAMRSAAAYVIRTLRTSGWIDGAVLAATPTRRRAWRALGRHNEAMRNRWGIGK